MSIKYNMAGMRVLVHTNVVAAVIIVMIAMLMQHTTQARPISREPEIKEPFAAVEGCRVGDTVNGIGQVKKYFHQFGYLDDSFDGVATTDNSAGAADTFDPLLEAALKVYQENFHLDPTGVLDAPTVQQMRKPRCGVADIINGTNYMKQHRHHHHMHGGGPGSKLHPVMHYSFFQGMPRWPPSQTHLTYAFVSDDQSNDFLRGVVPRAFEKWSAVSQFTFEEVNGASDIQIGFYRGDHGDGRPFDGPSGVLAHAFAPTRGLLHLDGDESWSTQPGPSEVDLESVCLHEMGHLLGLGHSSVVGAVMAPSIAPGQEVRDLQQDDIDGVTALYNL